MRVLQTKLENKKAEFENTSKASVGLKLKDNRVTNSSLFFKPPVQRNTEHSFSSTPIQLMLKPLASEERGEFELAISQIKEEVGRQMAVLGDNPVLTGVLKTLSKINLDTDHVALTKERLNTAIASLNKNIETGKVPDVQVSISAASSSKPVVTIHEIQANPYLKLAKKLKLLENGSIQHWMQREQALPENLVVGIIAEAMTANTVEEGLGGDPHAMVLRDLEIVKDSEDPKYKYTSIKQIDVLVVFRGPEGYVPIDLIETKAGLQGNRVEKTKHEASSKVQELKKIPTKHYKILEQGKDITELFDWEKIMSGHISASTAGVSEHHNIVLSPMLIDGVMQFLNLYHQFLQSE